MKVTLQRFGRKRRLVLMFEWLTLWPTCGALAVSSQRRDMIGKSSSIPALANGARRARGGPKSRPFPGTRGRIGGSGRRVKVFGDGKCLIAWQFCKNFSGLTHHIKGAIAADMVGAHNFWSCRARFAA